MPVPPTEIEAAHDEISFAVPRSTLIVSAPALLRTTVSVPLVASAVTA